MIQPHVATLAYRFAKFGDGIGDSLGFTVPQRTLPRSVKLNFPNGLVASSDEDVLQKLAEIMGRCGLATFLALTVTEARRILDHHDVSVVLCDDRMIDGGYDAIVHAAQQSRTKAPVIVVSPTGDWPDYLKAISAGAFDYQAYPPILGELPRAIRNALASRTASIFGETTTKMSKSSIGGIR